MLTRATRLAAIPLALCVPALAAAPAAEAKRTPAPKLTALRCIPKAKPACATKPTVAVGAQLQFSGTRLVRNMRVSFRWSNGALATRLEKTKVGWVARVPAGVKAGSVTITVSDKAGRRSNKRAITVVAEAPQQKPAVAEVSGPLPDAFKGDGMWVWYLKSTEGGDLDRIAEKAKRAGTTTLFIKSADGATPWSQFDAELVSELHARGLKACGWQFVYGDRPEAEADAAAASIRAGADCFVIDAETRYEGRYAAAQTYTERLRDAAGPTYPIGLTSFPYVDYHPRLPFSVFLGPGGAQANLPQVYWEDIGASVDAVSAKTVANNRIYEAPIAPIGQTYGGPSAADIRRFRAIWAGYGAPGVSWWSWQATPAALWPALFEDAPTPITSTDPGWPALTTKSTGDQVAWLQMHLKAFDAGVPIDARFAGSTATALKAFQASKGLEPSGVTDAETWQTLLELTPVAGSWN